MDKELSDGLLLARELRRREGPSFGELPVRGDFKVYRPSTPQTLSRTHCATRQRSNGNGVAVNFIQQNRSIVLTVPPNRTSATITGGSVLSLNTTKGELPKP